MNHALNHSCSRDLTWKVIVCDVKADVGLLQSVVRVEPVTSCPQSVSVVQWSEIRSQ